MIYEKFDCLQGITIGTTSNGTYVKLIDGNIGWISKKHIKTGINVIVTILYVKKENNFPILTLDSVLYPDEMVA